MHSWWTPLALAMAAMADPIQYSDPASGLTSAMSLIRNGSKTDIQMQMVVPQSAGWSAVGIGSQMQDALMFVIYPASNNKDVTVSVRSAPGHVMPTVVPGIEYQVTNSSVTPNGQVMADFTCYGCTTWPSGSLDTTSTQQSFIWATGPGYKFNSDDPNAQIEKHSNKGSFTGNAVAALTAASPATSAQPASTPLATPGHSSNSKPQYTGKAHQITHKMIMAHAAILSLVFFFFMPVAVILLRAPFMKSWAFTGHWVFQLIAWVMSVAGLGLSIAMAMRMKSYANLDFYHGIIGILVICLTIIQPLSGIYHHMKFVKIRRRTSVSWAHISFGWVIIFLGMLNGTFGLMLAGEIDAAGGLGAAGLVILIILILTSSFAARRKAAKTPIRGPPPPSPPTMERKKDIEMVVAAGERSGEDSSS